MMRPFSLDGYQLFHDGTLTLADIEATGIRVDVDYLREQDSRLSKELLEVEKSLWRMKEAGEWKSRYKDKTNFNSPTQLSTMLFKEWKHRPTKETARGNAAVDDEVLRRIGTPFTDSILRMRKLTKVKDTYIAGLLREQTDGLLHPSFNLHLVTSFRSSSDGPNFQNQPIRDPEQGEVVRKAFRPLKPSHQFVEIDMKAMEVCSNACYNKDPVLIEYIKNPKKDMHRDMAAECFLLEQNQVGKKIRYVGKNGFTFPAFYGSYFEKIAPAMWQAIDEHKLVTEDGIPLKKHLESKGIKSLQGFTEHIRDVEDNFWNERFKVYGQWKKDWWNTYLRDGYFDLLTGFRCQGPMRKNEVTNYPGQGTAFHFVLWGLIQLHRWLGANEMETKIIGEIHDSIILSVPPDELQTVLQKAQKILCSDIMKHWDWINVPLAMEAEAAPVGGTWNDKEPVKIGE